MKASSSWLKKYTDIDQNADELAEALTMLGLEVEAVSDRYDFLNTVIVSRVNSVTPHPNADRLKLCLADIGDQVLSVVCGAPNVAEGMLCACVLPGTMLPDKTVVKEGVIRGERSEAMLCSQSELGLGDDHKGVWELNSGLTVGVSLKEALDLADPVFEIDLTPNRPDCLSMIGVAREIAALHQGRVKLPVIKLPKATLLPGAIKELTSVTIEDPDLCPRYVARLVFDIQVAPSPFWLQDHLRSVGLNPINNIVDITNFVMLETGQPLHAFDHDRLAENRIVVRRAEQNETFTTLDNKEHVLTDDMLLICDGEKAVAIGGVMGGLNSEIEANTTRVLIESACFNPVSIRKTSKTLGMNTDASHRFERGVDPNGQVFAANRAAQLIAEIGKGQLIKGIVDEYPAPVTSKLIRLNTEAANRRLGVHLSTAQITEYLESIEFKVKEVDTNSLKVMPPSFRVDISRFEDLTEEIARLCGYNTIATTFPLIPGEARSLNPAIVLRNRIKDLLNGFGFSEAITYSFIGGSSYDSLRLEPNDPRRKAVGVLNPISEEQNVMRTTLIPGLLGAMQHNLLQQNKNLKLFEIGSVFMHADNNDGLPDEIEILAGLQTGLRTARNWQTSAQDSDFYDIKGALEALFNHLGVANVKFTSQPSELCHYVRPGHTARILIKDEVIGQAGEVHPDVLRNYDLKQTAFIFEIDIQRLTPHLPETVEFQPITKFPAIARDVTLIVGREKEAGDLLKTVADTGENLVENVQLLDIFTGDSIPNDQKSVSFRIIYRSAEKTLDDETINRLHAKIADKLRRSFDASFQTR
ncbi:phenylalanine--tRNA ligase subunit beta [Desulfococcaceae bacterium HSG9]|nr:phenylalanine--tRNA ligase subunit beta [Desulfococcaceae bacterium HSG9]